VSPGGGSVAAEAKPNPAHFALAKLEQKLQDRLFLCTPNVDDLHEQGGSKRVVHMHCELFKSRCDKCNRPQFHDRRPTIRQPSFPGAGALMSERG
jgi:NAD-dependent protein deacetylase/lipoamidase